MGEEESMEVGLEIRNEGIKEGDEGEEEEEEEAWSSDSEIENPLDWLDLKDGVEAVVDGAFAPDSRRPNAHGGAPHSCPVVHTSTAVQSEPETLQSHPRYAFGGVGGKGECSMSSTNAYMCRPLIRGLRWFSS